MDHLCTSKGNFYFTLHCFYKCYQKAGIPDGVSSEKRVKMSPLVRFEKVVRSSRHIKELLRHRLRLFLPVISWFTWLQHLIQGRERSNCYILSGVKSEADRCLCVGIFCSSNMLHSCIFENSPPLFNWNSSVPLQQRFMLKIVWFTQKKNKSEV